MTHGTEPATVSQMFALNSLLGGAIADAKLSRKFVQCILRDKKVSRQAVSVALGALGMELMHDPYADEREEAMAFLSSRGAPTTGLDEAVTPERPGDNWWLMPLARDYGCNAIYDNLWDFPKWRWTEDLDGKLAKQDLSAKFVWVRHNEDLEPDQETRGKSANQADPNQTSIELRVAMMYYVRVYAKTSRIPDKLGVTLCGGSRYLVGDVPNLYLNDDGRAGVCRYHPDDCCDASGARQQV